MSQYPKWLLALNFPSLITAIFTMIIFMFGGLHPFGNVDSMFWSFIIYAFNQIFWVFPIILFFLSLISWAYMREKISVGCAVAAWLINAAGLYFIFTA